MARLLGPVRDIDLSTVLKRPFDLAIFASGYEARCTWLPAQISPEALGACLVLGFPDQETQSQRIVSDRYFRERLRVDPTILVSGRPNQVSELIDEKLARHEGSVRILVDISSMSRNWYADILNWARFSPLVDEVEIVFSYTAGEYHGTYPTRGISETISLFGFEGRNDTQLETVALIGLGYDAITPHALVEDLQPELKYAFVSDNGDDANLERTVQLNCATIEELDGPVALVPLMSVEAAYRILGEMAAPHVGLRNTVFVCLGPKTHVLASLLVAARNEEISCLHVRGSSNYPLNIVSAQQATACTVVFRQQKPHEVSAH